jgi:CheY-like chemotaxis protein
MLAEDHVSMTQILSKLIPLKVRLIDALSGFSVNFAVCVQPNIMMPKELAAEEQVTVLFVTSNTVGESQLSSQLQQMSGLHVLVAQTVTMALDILTHGGASIELVLVDIDLSPQPLQSQQLEGAGGGGGADCDAVLNEQDNAYHTENMKLLEQICHEDGSRRCQNVLMYDDATRSGGLFGGVPVIALTHSDDMHLHRRCFQAGAKEILMKPLQGWHQNKIVHWGRVHRLALRSKASKASKVKLPSLEINVLAERDAAMDEEGLIEEDQTVQGHARSRSRHHTGNTSTWTGGHSPSDTEADASLAKQPGAASHGDTEAMSHGPNGGQDLHVHSAVGTLHYLAPEVIVDRRYGECIDWWACGVTFYECLAKEHLFGGTHKQTIVQNILSAPIGPAVEPLLKHSKDLHNLVTGLLERDFTKRLGFCVSQANHGAKAIKNHKFFRKFEWDKFAGIQPKFRPAQMPIKRQTDAARNHFFGNSAASQTLGTRYSLSSASFVTGGSSVTRSRKTNSDSQLRSSDTIKLSTLRQSRMTSGTTEYEIIG